MKKRRGFGLRARVALIEEELGRLREAVEGGATAGLLGEGLTEAGVPLSRVISEYLYGEEADARE